MVQWHTPQKEVGSDALQLARVGQLPQLLTQQVEEERRLEEEELVQLRQDYDEKLFTRHKVKEIACTCTFSVESC